jgi:IS5 family transposase
MYIIAYSPDESFEQNPLVQAAREEPRYRLLRELLEYVFHDPAVELSMRHDLAPPDKQATWNGRPATPMIVTGSLCVVRRLMGWSYRTEVEQVTGSAAWRWVCGLQYRSVPNYRTLRDREARLSPQTVQVINAKVIEVAQALGFSNGNRLRLDSTVTESNIHYPTDHRLLDDAARVLSRSLRRAGQVVPADAPEEKAWFRDRHRQARRLARQIGQRARQAGRQAGRQSRQKSAENKDKSLGLYRQLIQVVEMLIQQAGWVCARLGLSTHPAALRLKCAIEHYTPLAQRVIDQTRRRVLQGEQVPAEDKLVSLFEPHTYIICRGKAKPNDTEFGHKVWFAEVEGGFISEYRLLDGNPPDAQHVIPSLDAHRRSFGHSPHELSGDRGLYSLENEQQARVAGVKRVSLPKPGSKTPRRQRLERQRWFRAAQRFRCGVEGRISQLRRARRLNRCLNHGIPGFERWIGWGVVANNLAAVVNTAIKRRTSIGQSLP